MHLSPKENFITTKDAGEIFGYTSDYLARLARSGKIVGRRVGHSWLIDKESLTNFLNQQGDRKIDYARALARTREAEYRAHRSAIHRATRALTLQFSMPQKSTVVEDAYAGSITSSLRSQAFAISVALLVVISGALTARATAVPRLAHVAAGLASEAASGFNATFGDIPSRVIARIGEADSGTHTRSARVAADTANAFAGIASPLLADVNLSSLRMAIADRHAVPVALVPNSAHVTGVAPIAPLTSEDARAFVLGAYAFVTTPSLAADTLAHAYAALGADAYAAISASFSAYRSLIELSGTTALALAVTTRDTLATAPHLVARINLALGTTIIDATHLAIRADVATAYGLAEAAPASARATVAIIGGAGDVVARAAARLPVFAAAAFLRALETPARIAPALAQAVFDTEYSAAIRFVHAALAVSERYLAFAEGAGRLAYAGTARTFALADSAVSPIIHAPTALGNAYLRALGRSALALDTFPLRSIGEAGLAAALPALSVGERVALVTYETISNFFDSTSRTFVALFAPPPTIVLPTPNFKHQALTSAPPPRPAIVNSYPTYTTVVQGISADVMNQSLASLRADVIATASGMIRPVHTQTVTNASTIQMVNKIEDLSNLIVRNGDFRGGSLTNGTSVSATTGTFTNLAAGTTTLATTAITGDLSVSGTLTSNIISATDYIKAPYFVATSTTATSTFAGAVGIGTTTPSTKFSVGGAAGDTSGHGYFTGGLGVGLLNTLAGTLNTSGAATIGGALTVNGQCVAADTKLRRRRRRKKGEEADSENGEWEDGGYIYDAVMVKDVRAGDEIASLHPIEGRIVWSRVNALMFMGKKEIRALRTASNRLIRTTENHPYFVRSRRARPAQKLYRFEVDISNKVEHLSRDTIVAISSGEHSATALITAEAKRALLSEWRAAGASKRFAPSVYAALIVEALAHLPVIVHELLIDTDYVGYDALITNTVRHVAPDANLEFVRVGKKSPAHHVAYRVHSRLAQADARITLEALGEKTESALRAPSRSNLSAERFGGPQALSLHSKIFDGGQFVKEGVWTVAKELREGQEIAVVYGEGEHAQVAWEPIISIAIQRPEPVYDIEVEGTHNFIGNGIVAHNTAIFNQASTTMLTNSGSTWLTSLSASSLIATDANKLLISTTSIGVANLALAKGNFLVGSDASVAQATSTIFISSTGNVGIGTTSPYRTLSVSGSGVFTGGDLLASTITATSSITANSLSLTTALPVSSGGTGVGTFSSSQLLYGNGTNALSSVATSSYAVSGPFVTSGTLGALVGGSNSIITWTGLATTSQPASSNLLVSNGAAGVYGVGTTSATCSAGVACTSFNVLGGANPSFALAALGSAGVLGAQTATAPTVQATSTLYGVSTGGMVLGWNNATGGIAWVATSTGGTASSTLLADTNTWSGTNTFTNAPVLSTFSGLIAGNSGATYQVSTTSMNASITGNAGTVTNGVYTTDTGSVTNTMLAGSIAGGKLLDAGVTYAKLQNVNYGEIIGRNTAGAGVSTGLSTSTYKSMLALTSSDVGLGNVTNNAQVTSVTGSWPIVSSGGTTPAISWTGLATTSQPSSSNLLVSNGTSGVYGVATSSLAVGSGISVTSGTLGSQIGGSNATLGIATNALALTQLPQIAANSLLGNATGAAGNVTALSTSTLNIGGTAGNVTGTVAVSNGGTGQTTFSASQLLYGNGTNALSSVATSSFAASGFPASYSGTFGAFVGGTGGTWTYWGLATTSQPASSNLLVSNGTSGVYGVATTSASCSSGVSCTGFNVLGGANPSFALAALGSAGVLGAQTATAPTVQATSTLYGTGTGGQVLGWSNATGGLAFVATSTGSGGTPGGSLGQLQWNSNSTFAGISTTTPSLALGLNYSGTLGSLVGGAAGTLSLATSSLYSGTTGQFPYFSGTNTLTATSSLLLASSGNVGIGTTAPGEDLHLNAAAPVIRMQDSDNDAGNSASAYLEFGKTTAGAWSRSSYVGDGSGSNANLILYAESGNSIVLSSNGADPDVSPEMMIKNGNVGIGTTNPGLVGNGKVLTISGSSAISRLELQQTPALSTALGTLSTVEFYNGATRVGTIEGFSDSATDAGGFIFWTQATGGTLSRRLIILGNGNVGIGTTIPGAQLDLSTDSARKLTTTTWTTGSDSRFKTNIESIGNALDIISQIRPVKFRYNSEFLAAHPSVTNTDYYNFIAQEYQQVFPNSVTETDGRLYLNSSNMIPYAIAGVKELDKRTSFIVNTATSTVLTVDVAGNVGIGTTTPNHTLTVAGDIGAIAFVNTSTRSLKTDINYATASSTEDMLRQLVNLKVATYRYKIEPQNDPLRLGLIAEDAQQIAPEILSTDGKGVDIYKLAIFTLSGVQALASKMDAQEVRLVSLEDRMSKLESGAVGTATTSSFSLSTTSLASALESFGVLISKGFAQFVKIATDNLQVGSSTHPTGITMYDKTTGQPYCVQVDNGSATTTPGACAVAVAVAAPSAPVAAPVATTTETTTAVSADTTATTATETATTTTVSVDTTPPAASDVEPPVVTLVGDAALEIPVGGTFTDPGATASDDVDGDLTARIVETGAVDTAIPGLYELTYTATDAAGNSSSVSRVVTVIAPTISP